MKINHCYYFIEPCFLIKFHSLKQRLFEAFVRTNGHSENKDTLYWVLHKEGLTNFTTPTFFLRRKVLGCFDT